MPFWSESIQVAALLFFVAAVVWASASDLARYEIPDWASIIIVLAFFPAAVSADLAAADIALNLAVGVAVLILGIGLFSANVFGGGDGKLLAAGAVWAGWDALVPYLLAVAIAGGALTLFLLVFRRIPLPSSVLSIGWVTSVHGERTNVPYGVAIAAGSLFVLPRMPAVALFQSL